PEFYHQGARFLAADNWRAVRKTKKAKEEDPDGNYRLTSPRLRGEHAEAAVAQRAELAAARHRRRDGGGDGQGRRRRRDLHLRLLALPVRCELRRRGAEEAPRPHGHREAGRSGRPEGGRRHRRVEEDAGRG